MLLPSETQLQMIMNALKQLHAWEYSKAEASTPTNFHFLLQQMLLDLVFQLWILMLTPASELSHASFQVIAYSKPLLSLSLSSFAYPVAQWCGTPNLACRSGFFVFYWRWVLHIGAWNVLQSIFWVSSWC